MVSAQREATTALEERERPTRAVIALLAGFVVLVVLAFVTVLIPELRDDADEDERSASAASEAREGPGS